MKTYEFKISGFIEDRAKGTKKPFTETGTFEAFNFNHALSYVFNFAKEKKLTIKNLDLKEYV